MLFNFRIMHVSLGLAYARVHPDASYPQEPPRWAELVAEGELPTEVVEVVGDLDDIVLAVVGRRKATLTDRTRVDFLRAVRAIAAVAGSVRPDEQISHD